MPSILTSDLDALFVPRLEEVAADLSTPMSVCLPIHLASVMKSESDVRANAWNDNPKSLPPEQRWNASGLIQFMPPTLLGLGWTKGHAEFRKLSATEQLPFVRRYFAPHRGQLGSIGAIYTATFLPALLAHAGDPSFVLTAKNGPLGWAYAPNASFDVNGDLAITVGELESAVLRNCKGARWAEIAARIGHAVPVENYDEFDLSTVVGMQAALNRLSYDVGNADGIAGPKTHAALAKFQSERGLAVDGIYGPRTRAALEIALKTSA
jgi:hypothetical protein